MFLKIVVDFFGFQRNRGVLRRVREDIIKGIVGLNREQQLILLFGIEELVFVGEINWENSLRVLVLVVRECYLDFIKF